MTEARKRRIRILCLHGSTQSAASFRATLKPLCDQMGKHFEFHFLEAPYIIPDPGESEQGQDNWTRAAILASRVSALETDQSYRKSSESSGVHSAIPADDIRREVDQIKQQLKATAEGREIEEKSKYEDIEGLVSRKTGRSLSRNWVTSLEGSTDRVVGVQLALAEIGDYMRENGTFHGVIGYETGGRLAILIQSLLSHPLSSAMQFPSFFPQLPKGVNRMPRMGGWEEQPPAPDDPRLGSENLTKNYVPAQKPFEVIISLSPKDSSQADLGAHADQWCQSHPPLLHTTSKEGFLVHTISISAGGEAKKLISMEKTYVCKPEDDILDAVWSRSLADWMKMAIESCQGDEKARERISQLDVVKIPAKL